MDTSFPTFRRLVNYRIPIPAWWPSYTTAWQHQTLLRLIAVALEDNLPLAPLIEQWAEDGQGIQKDRLHRLAHLLHSGRALPDALEEVPGVLREEDLLALRFDAQSGTRTATIRAMQDDSQAARASQLERIHGDFLYFSLMALIGLVFFVFLQVKIIPVFLKILSEFGAEPSRMLPWSIEVARGVAEYWWFTLLVMGGVLWLLFSTRSEWRFRLGLLWRAVYPLRELDSADVLQKLGVAVTSGRPIPGALSTLARYHFDPTIRHKLLFVRNEVEQGADVWQTMTTAGLLT